MRFDMVIAPFQGEDVILMLREINTIMNEFQSFHKA
jgi:hypothetical protein